MSGMDLFDRVFGWFLGGLLAAVGLLALAGAFGFAAYCWRLVLGYSFDG